MTIGNQETHLLSRGGTDLIHAVNGNGFKEESQRTKIAAITPLFGLPDPGDDDARLRRNTLPGSQLRATPSPKESLSRRHSHAIPSQSDRPPTCPLPRE